MPGGTESGVQHKGKNHARRTFFWGLATFFGWVLLTVVLSPFYLRTTMQPFYGMRWYVGLLAVALAGAVCVLGLFWRARKEMAGQPGAWRARVQAGIGLLAAVACVWSAGAMVADHYRWGLQLKAINARNQARIDERNAVMQTLGVLHTALDSYRAKYGQFPARLAELGPPRPGAAASAEAGGFLDAQMAQGAKDGYLYQYAARDQGGEGKLDAYTIQANPVVREYGKFRYSMDESGSVSGESIDAEK